MNKPTGIDPLADRILQALSRRPESSEIVLGGYLALQHYADYRETHDIDAWWRELASAETEAAVLAVMHQAAADAGAEVRERRWRDTISIELCRGSQKQFAFQISERSIELEPPVQSSWPPILIETIADNVGSKMSALVERGTPRDFLDIRTIVEKGIRDAAQCWGLWARKNPEDRVEVGKQKALHHLTVLETRRPLESIVDAAERRRAAATRDWYRAEFLRI